MKNEYFRKIIEIIGPHHEGEAERVVHPLKIKLHFQFKSYVYQNIYEINELFSKKLKNFAF